MDKLFMRAYMVRGEDGKDEAGSPIRFIASTEGIKRDGKNLSVEQWRLDNFRKNPVFLWVHDYFGRNLPIGRVPSVSLEDKRLISDVIFDQGDDFARQVERKYRDGFLNAVSVGWNDIQEGKEVSYELLDISAVPVPGDPDALMEREGAGLRSVYRELGKLFEDEDTLTPGPSPLQGEGGRAGAVLSGRNRGDLEQAVGLIQGVLERAKKEAAEEEGEERGAGELELSEAMETLRKVSEKIDHINLVHTGGA